MPSGAPQPHVKIKQNAKTQLPMVSRHHLQILIQHRNERAEFSPALEAALKLVGPRPQSKIVEITTGQKISHAVLFWYKNKSVLWTHEKNIHAVLPTALVLGVDGVFSWDCGIPDIASVAGTYTGGTDEKIAPDPDR